MIATKKKKACILKKTKKKDKDIGQKKEKSQVNEVRD